MLEKRGFEVDRLKKRLIDRHQVEIHHVEGIPSNATAGAVV